jgi:hypothetical protein
MIYELEDNLNFLLGIEQMGSILVFALGLAFAHPCSADPTMVLNQFVHTFGPVIKKVVYIR